MTQLTLCKGCRKKHHKGKRFIGFTTANCEICNTDRHCGIIILK